MGLFSVYLISVVDDNCLCLDSGLFSSFIEMEFLLRWADLTKLTVKLKLILKAEREENNTVIEEKKKILTTEVEVDGGADFTIFFFGFNFVKSGV